MDSAPAPPPRWLVLGLAVLTVVAVGVLSLSFFLEDLEPENPPSPEESAADLGVATDDFDRPDADTLADADHAWEEVSGSWAVQDGHAALVQPAEGDARNLALLRGAPDGVLRVTVTAVEPGWGVAFRVQDEANYLSLVAGTDSWSFERVVDGVPTETRDFLAVTPADRMQIEIHLAGSSIDVSIDGGTPARTTEELLIDGERIGLLAVTGENAASMAWDDFGLARV